MARGFNLTAEINLRGPANIRQVVSNIQKQLGTISANVNLNLNSTTNRSITQINNNLRVLNQTLTTTTQAANNASQAFTGLAAAMRSVGSVNLPTNISTPIVRTTEAATNASRAIAQTRTEFEDFGRQAGLAVRRFAAFSSVTAVIYGFSNALNQGIKQYIEFDKQITRLSQVTNESKASLGSLAAEITRLSTNLGVASEDLAGVAVTLAQAGFTAQDTRKALDALAKSTLAPSFENINQTVEGSIALMRQFGISANQLEGALGSVNAVAAAFAVEASDIIAAIQRTGGVFASASKGVSQGTDALNEFIAVFTSIRSTTRESAETIATGLRTIFTRIQRSDTVDALKDFGVVLTDLEGKFVGPYEAVRRLSEGLGRLDPRDLKFSQIIEELGGFRQIGKVLPLIQQFATAQDALKIAQKGQGSLSTDAAKGQLALAIQIQKVREEFTALVRSIGDSQGFQTMVRLGLDLASALVKVGDATKGILPLIGIMAAFRGASALTQFVGGFGSGLRGGRNQRANAGGRIYGFASGGLVPGDGDRDTIPAMLTPGEFVLNKQAVKKYGVGNLVTINKYGSGGGVYTVQQLQSKQKKIIDSGLYKKSNLELDDRVRANIIPIQDSTPLSLSEIRAIKNSYKGLNPGQIKLLKNAEQRKRLVRIRQNSRGASRKDIILSEEFAKAERVWGQAYEKIVMQRNKELSSANQGDANYPVDVKRGPIGAETWGEVKFKTTKEPKKALTAKLLAKRILDKHINKYFTENKPSPDSIDGAKKPVDLGDLEYYSGISNNNNHKLQFYKGLNSGGKIQKFMAGGTATAKKPKEVFGTGETNFPKRISNAYAKEQQKAEEDLKAKLAWYENPDQERIVVDTNKVQEQFKTPFDRQKFIDSFKQKITRNSLFSRMADFAKFIGLPEEDLSSVLPLQLDFGGTEMTMFAAAQFSRGARGTRPYEGYDLSRFGYGEKQKQDIYGLEKLIEAKKKEIRKITETPVKTFDDGSFSTDDAAYFKANNELKELNNKLFALKDLKKQAEKKALTEQESQAQSTGRGTVSFAKPLGFGRGTQNSVMYHELTHQLLNSLRTRSSDSFDKYKERVNSLFAGDNDALADAFDALTADGSYSSADVVYGRSYKIGALRNMLMNYSRRSSTLLDGETNNISPDITKNLASLSSQSDRLKKAREFRPVNPKVNEALLTGEYAIGQDVLERLEDSGKEEFLTTLIQKAPQLDQNLQTVLDETLANLLGSAGISRQRYSVGGSVQRFMEGGVAQRRVGVIDSDVLRDKKNAARVADGMQLLGATSEADYAIKLSKLAGEARQSGSLSKFRVMAGAAANRKSSVATGRGANDDARLRKTIRKHIMHPDDLKDVGEAISVTTTLKESKLDYMGMADRIYVKDSSTEDEQKLIKLFEKQRNLQKDSTLYGRETGTTESLSPDYGLQTASLISQFGTTEDRTNKGKVMTLGEKMDAAGNPRFQIRRKRTEELPELISAKGQFPGAASPLTRGHAETAVDTLLKKVREKYPNATHKDLLFALAPDLSLDGGSQGREHGARYGEYPASFRRDLIKLALPEMMISSANRASQTGINSRMAEIEASSTGRRRFAVMEKDAPVVISKAENENPEGVMERYRSAGLTPYNIARSADVQGDSISGTATRQAVIDKDYSKLDLAVLPQVGSALKVNQPQLRNRRLMVPLVQQAIDLFVKSKSDLINEQVNNILQKASGGPFTRMTPKFKETHPDLVKQITNLRRGRDDIQKEAFLDPAHDLITAISSRYSDIYGLDVKRQSPLDVQVSENDIKQHIVEASKLSGFFKPGLSFSEQSTANMATVVDSIQQTVAKAENQDSSTSLMDSIKQAVTRQLAIPKGSGDLPTTSTAITSALGGTIIPADASYGIFAGKRVDAGLVKKVWRQTYAQMSEDKTASYTAAREFLRQKYVEIKGSKEEQLEQAIAESQMFGLAGLLPVGHSQLSGPFTWHLGKNTAGDEVSVNASIIERGISKQVEDSVIAMQSRGAANSELFAKDIGSIIGKSPRSLSKEQLETFGQGNIEGSTFEQGLARLHSFIDNISSRTRPIDFPEGLGDVAELFPGLPANIPTEVKRTIDSDSRSKAIEEFQRHLRLIYGIPEPKQLQTKQKDKVQALNIGGIVQRFADGGEAKDTLEEYFIDSSQINSDLINSKSLSKESRTKLAQKVRNLRSLSTPVSETLYSSISRFAFNKFASDVNLNKTPEISTGTRIFDQKKFYDTEVKKIIGKSFSLPGFMSTSKEFSKAKSFLDNAARDKDKWAAMFTIKTKKNASGVDVAEQLKDRKINVTKQDINPRTGEMETFHMEPPSSEKEVILPPRSKFKVDSARFVDLMGNKNIWADIQQFESGGEVVTLGTTQYLASDVVKAMREITQNNDLSESEAIKEFLTRLPNGDIKYTNYGGKGSVKLPAWLKSYSPSSAIQDRFLASNSTIRPDVNYGRRRGFGESSSSFYGRRRFKDGGLVDIRKKLAEEYPDYNFRINPKSSGFGYRMLARPASKDAPESMMAFDLISRLSDAPTTAKKLIDQIKEQEQSKRFASGGTVDLYHGSNTGVNDSVLESFKREGARSDIASGYGQGSGFYMYTEKNRAISQAKMRVGGGGNFVLSQGDTAGKPMVLTFNETLDPATYDLDYELQKGLVVDWLYKNYSILKDKIAPKLTAQERYAGVSDVVDKNLDQGIMSSGIRVQSETGSRKTIYSGTEADIREGELIGQIMNRLQANDPETVYAFESELFKSPLGLVLKYVGSSPLKPKNIETFATGGSIARFEDGGYVPALLTPGEAVIGPKLAKKIGYSKLNRMNHADKYAAGGEVGIVPGSGNTDTFGPVPLPVGSFVIRKKATEALGFNSGGRVQRFLFGGSAAPKANPDISGMSLSGAMGVIGASASLRKSLAEVAKALEGLGVSSSNSATILNKNKNSTAEAAIRAAKADYEVARAAGTSATTLYTLKKSIDDAEKSQQNQILAQQRIQKKGLGGADLQTLLDDAQKEESDLLDKRRQQLTNKMVKNKKTGKTKRQFDDDQIENILAKEAEKRRSKAVKTAAGKQGISTGGIDNAGMNIEKAINSMMKDANILSQMNKKYIEIKNDEIDAALAAGTITKEMADKQRTLVQEEVRVRQQAIQESAQSNRDSGPNSRDDNRGFLFSAAIISVGSIIASSIDVKSSATNAGIAAGIQSGSTTFGTGMGLRSEVMRFGEDLQKMGGGFGRVGSLLTKFGGSLVMGATAAATAVNAINAFQNAVEQFYIDLAKSRLETSLAGFEQELDTINKNLNNISFDQLNIKIDRASSEFTTVLSRLSNQTIYTWSNLLDRLTGASSKRISKLSQIEQFGGIDAANRARVSENASRTEFTAIIPILAQQQAALGQAAAEAVAGSLRTKFQTGQTSEDIIDSDQFESIANILANANVAIREQILSIENSGMDDATIASNKKALIEQYAKEKIRLEAMMSTREKDSKSLSRIESIYTRSLSRMFENMNQAVNSTNFALQKLTDSADLTSKALKGEAQAGEINLSTIDILKNPRGYSSTQQSGARASAAEFFGSRSDVIPGLLAGPEEAQASIMSTINQTLEQNADATNEVVARKIDINLRKVFRDLSLPPELADRLAKEVGLSIADIRKDNDELLDFNLLAEKVGSLGKVMGTFELAQNSVIQAMQAYQGVLNAYTKQTNELIELSISQNQKERQATEILRSSFVGLQKALGENIRLEDSRARLASRVRGFTGQAETDSGNIFNRFMKLNQERLVSESARQTAGERNLAGKDDFEKFNKEVEQSSIAMRENYQALKLLAENTEYAADAMSKIQEIQQKIGGRVSLIEKVATSTPEELNALGSAMSRLQNNMNGQLNTIQSSVGAQKAYNEALRNGSSVADAMSAAQAAFANERKETLGALNDILPFLGTGKETNNVRANVLESMLRESGVGVNPMFAQVLNALRNPAADPELAAAIDHYNEANNLQAEANRHLAQIEAELAKDKSQTQAQALIAGLKGVTLKFESQELKDLNDSINRLVPITPAQTKADGGIIYASAGQMVNFQPKGTDTVPAMLTPGEFVVNRGATQRHLPLLQSINSGKYSKGGSVRYYADGGYVHNFVNRPADITQADLVSDNPVIDFRIPAALEDFRKGSKTWYKIPYHFTFINSNKQTPDTNDVDGNLDMTQLKPTDGKVVPGIGPAYSINRSSMPSILASTITYHPTTTEQENLFNEKIIDSDENILPPSTEYASNIRKSEQEEWRKKAELVFKDGKRKTSPLLPNSMGSIPNLNDFHGSFNTESFNANYYSPDLIWGLTDSISPLQSVPNQGYSIWRDTDAWTRREAVSTAEPKFNVGPFASAKWNKTVGDTRILNESVNNIIGEEYESLVKNFKDRFKLYNDTLTFFKFQTYKEDKIPADVSILAKKLENLYEGKSAFEFFGNEGKDSINIEKYFPNLKSLTDRPTRSLAVFQNNDKALKELVLLYNNRPDLAKNVFIGWNDPSVPKDFGTNEELGIEGWGNLAHQVQKPFPWVLNANLSDLSKETLKELEEGIKASNPGDIKVNLKTVRQKMNIPQIAGIVPQLANAQADLVYSYDEWEGKLFDPKTRDFMPPVEKYNLPQINAGGIFNNDNLDIDKYRFLGDDQIDPLKIKIDGNKTQDIMDYYSAILNKDDAEKQRIAGALKNAITYTWNERKFIGQSFGGIPALNVKTEDATGVPVDITSYILKQAESALIGLGTKAGKADAGFAQLKGSSISDNDLPGVVRNLSQSALQLFGTRMIPGFPRTWLSQYIGKIPLMKNMNPSFAKRISQYASGIFNQAGGSVDRLLNSGNFNPRISDYLKETWTLLSGAYKAFSGLGSGNTRLIAQIRDIGGDASTLFRTLGAGTAIGQLMGLKLNQNWENLVTAALQDSKIKNVGAGGTLSNMSLEDSIPKDVKGLADLIFNPYNEFASSATRLNLIDSFINDLINYRGVNAQMGPFRGPGANTIVDSNTMKWIKDRSDILKLWYGGDGVDWVGQDYLYDKTIEPDSAQRAIKFNQSLVDSGKDYYDMANKAHIELGLGERFGPLPTKQWFTSRVAQGFQTGGVVYADAGGQMVNFQPRGTDTIPAMLTPGEFVVNRAATQKNLPLLHSINNGAKPYSMGGIVYAQTGGQYPTRTLPNKRPQLSDNQQFKPLEAEVSKPIVSDNKPKSDGAGGGRTYGAGGALGIDVGAPSSTKGKERPPSALRSYLPDASTAKPIVEPPADETKKPSQKHKGPQYFRRNTILRKPTEALHFGGIVYAADGRYMDETSTGGSSNAREALVLEERQKDIASAFESATKKASLFIGAERDNTKKPALQSLLQQRQQLLEAGAELGSSKASQDNFDKQLKKYNDQILNNSINTANAFNNGSASSSLDALSLALDVAGLIPVVGNFADLANVGVNLIRGDLTGAGLSVLAAVPLLGGLAGGAKIGLRGAQAINTLKNIDKAIGSAQLGVGLGEAGLAFAEDAKNPSNMFAGAGLVYGSLVVRENRSGTMTDVTKYFAGTDENNLKETMKEWITNNKPNIAQKPKKLPKAPTAAISDIIADADTRNILSPIKKPSLLKRLIPRTKLGKFTAVATGVGLTGLYSLWTGSGGVKETAMGSVGSPKEIPNNPPINPKTITDDTGNPINTASYNNDYKALHEWDAKQKPLHEKNQIKLSNIKDNNSNKIPDLIEDVFSILNTNQQKAALLRELRKKQSKEQTIESLIGNIKNDLDVGYVHRWLKDNNIKNEFYDDKYYARGGVVYADSGMLVPYQPKGTDTVPAMLTPGEFVVNRAATQKNLPLLKSINNGANSYSSGGIVYAADGGTVSHSPVNPFTGDVERKADGTAKLVKYAMNRTLYNYLSYPYGDGSQQPLPAWLALLNDLGMNDFSNTRFFGENEFAKLLDIVRTDTDATTLTKAASGFITNFKYRDLQPNNRLTGLDFTTYLSQSKGILGLIDPDLGGQYVPDNLTQWRQAKQKVDARSKAANVIKNLSPDLEFIRSAIKTQNPSNTKNVESTYDLSEMKGVIYSAIEKGRRFYKYSTNNSISSVVDDIYNNRKTEEISALIDWLENNSDADTSLQKQLSSLPIATEHNNGLTPTDSYLPGSEAAADFGYGFLNAGQAIAEIIRKISQGKGVIRPSELFTGAKNSKLAEAKLAITDALARNSRIEGINALIQARSLFSGSDQKVVDPNRIYDSSMTTTPENAPDRADMVVRPGEVRRPFLPTSTGLSEEEQKIQDTRNRTMARDGGMPAMTTREAVALWDSDKDGRISLEEYKNINGNTDLPKRKFGFEEPVFAGGTSIAMLGLASLSTPLAMTAAGAAGGTSAMMMASDALFGTNMTRPDPLLSTDNQFKKIAGEDGFISPSEVSDMTNRQYRDLPEDQIKEADELGKVLSEARDPTGAKKVVNDKAYTALPKAFTDKIRTKLAADIESLKNPFFESMVKNKNTDPLFANSIPNEIVQAMQEVHKRRILLGETLKEYPSLADETTAYLAERINQVNKFAEKEFALSSSVLTDISGEDANQKTLEVSYDDRPDILMASFLKHAYDRRTGKGTWTYGASDVSLDSAKLSLSKDSSILETLPKDLDINDAIDIVWNDYNRFIRYNKKIKKLTSVLKQNVELDQPTELEASAKSTGGIIYASQGTLVNYQPRGTDTVPAMLTPGEFVVNRAATQKHLPLLQSINNGYYADGGSVSGRSSLGPLPSKIALESEETSIIDLLQFSKDQAYKNQNNVLSVDSKVKKTNFDLNAFINYAKPIFTKIIEDMAKNHNDNKKNLGQLAMMMDNKINESGKFILDHIDEKLIETVNGIESSINNTIRTTISQTIGSISQGLVQTIFDQGQQPMIPDIAEIAEPKSTGGIVYANQGMLIPYQPKGTDTVPAMLTPGEFVVNRAATQKHLPLLRSINSSKSPSLMSSGGIVYLQNGGMPNQQNLDDQRWKEEFSGQRRPTVRQDQARERYEEEQNNRKAIGKFKSPIGREVAKQIITTPKLFDAIDDSAINEQADYQTKLESYTKDFDKIAPDKLYDYAKARYIRDSVRFNYLKNVAQNSNFAIDKLKPSGDLDKIVDPNLSPLTAKRILEIQRNHAAAEALAWDKLWKELGQKYPSFKSGINPNAGNSTPSVPAAFSSGGIVYANNGMLIPYKPRGTDTVPAMLTPGEFVVNAKATAQHLPLLQSINDGQRFMSTGGVVYAEDGSYIPYKSQYDKNRDKKRQAYEAEMARRSNLYATRGSSNNQAPTQQQQTQRVSVASQASFDPRSYNDVSKQIATFGTLLTGVNQVIVQFGSVLQQLVRGAGVPQATVPNGGVNNAGQQQNGIGQFTATFDRFINQLQKLNIPQQINLTLTQQAPLEINVNGADALQKLLEGPLGQIVQDSVRQALNNQGIANEEPPK